MYLILRKFPLNSKCILQNLSQSPRFKLETGSAREVEDKSDQCRKWKRHGACKLDQDFQLSEKNPSFQTEVGSKIMFEFMQKTCLKTCGWAPGGENHKLQKKGFKTMQ